MSASFWIVNITAVKNETCATPQGVAQCALSFSVSLPLSLSLPLRPRARALSLSPSLSPPLSLSLPIPLFSLSPSLPLFSLSGSRIALFCFHKIFFFVCVGINERFSLTKVSVNPNPLQHTFWWSARALPSLEGIDNKCLSPSLDINTRLTRKKMCLSATKPYSLTAPP